MHWQFFHLTVTLQKMSNNCTHSVLSVLYLYDSFFSRYIIPQMKNSSVMLLAGWFPQFFFVTFCDCNNTSCLLDLWASVQHWCWSAIVTHHLQSDCQMKNCQRVLFYELEHVNGIWREQKYASAILNSSDLSLGIYCNYS